MEIVEALITYPTIVCLHAKKQNVEEIQENSQCTDTDKTNF